MRQFVRFGLVVSFIVGSSAIAGAQALKTGNPDGKSAAPARPAMLDQVVATVNGEPIIRDDLYRLLENTGTPPGASIDEDHEIYRSAIEQFINRKLLNQYLKKQASLAVTEKEVDVEFAKLADQLKKGGEDIYVRLASVGVSVPFVREEMKEGIRNRKYLDAVATDANLKKYVADNKDVFNRTQVQASHIVLRVEPNASAGDKERVRQKLLAIKQEVESGKISFADAANKNSEDEANKTSPRGGDIGYFPRKGLFTEPFVAAAFALKTGSISAPVETAFGMHLIMVTDRKEGTPVDFEQNKLYIRNEYAADLHERIIAMEKKTAKIKIEPMPADFFPKIQPPATATTPAEAPKTATPGKAAGPK